MAQAVREGVESVEGVVAVCRKASDATLEDLLACHGLVLGTPENFGYMSGALKDFFDRTYDDARGHVLRKPYVVFISAGNDGSGALNSIERIACGYQFRKVYEPVIARGALKDDVLARCRELGQTLAAGCEAGIY